MLSTVFYTHNVLLWLNKSYGNITISYLFFVVVGLLPKVVSTNLDNRPLNIHANLLDGLSSFAAALQVLLQLSLSYAIAKKEE